LLTLFEFCTFHSPHYQLETATKALKAGLEEHGLIHLYKEEPTPDFTQEIIKQFNKNWFFINNAQVVRDIHKDDS
jgi:hypothetical protein